MRRDKVREGDIRREASIHGPLEHPSIVPFEAFFMDDTYVYMVLRFMAKGSLVNYLEKLQNPLSELAIRKIATEVVAGVVYLHGLGILHRDIKPANILVDGDGSAMLSDFGCAMKMGETLPCIRTGTPFNMAPEVDRWQPYSYPCDIWSVGTSVLEVVAWPPPEILYTSPVDQVQAFIPETSSPQLRHFLTALLQENPALRLTAPEMASHAWLQ